MKDEDDADEKAMTQEELGRMRYDKLQRIWDENNMTCIRDYLIYYNN